MKKYFIVPAFSCLIFLNLHCATKSPSGAPTTNNSTSPTSSKFADDILENVNQYRHTKGLKPLVMNNVISAEARKHSEDMANDRMAFGHDGFDARIQRISSQLGAARQSAENVALGDLSAQQVVSNWINSPGHRQNIEGNFTLTGIGVAKNKKGVTYFTQIFIRN